MYKQIPQEFTAAGDAYTPWYDEIIQDILWKVKCIDDTPLHENSIEEAFYHPWDYLHSCALISTVINDQKFLFCKKLVTFATLHITPSGISQGNIISLV